MVSGRYDFVGVQEVPYKGMLGGLLLGDLVAEAEGEVVFVQQVFLCLGLRLGSGVDGGQLFERRFSGMRRDFLEPAANYW